MTFRVIKTRDCWQVNRDHEFVASVISEHVARHVCDLLNGNVPIAPLVDCCILCGDKLIPGRTTCRRCSLEVDKNQPTKN